MLFVEEYEIDPVNIPAMLELLNITVEILNELKLPYLKGWTTYQCKEEPTRIRGVWVLEEQTNVDQLTQAYMGHPKGQTIPPKFMALIKEDSYASKTYDELISF